jgi:DNA-binding GntR family transcriptional regulator
VATLNQQQVSEIYDVRDVLDGLAGTLAARHATRAEVTTLREMLRRQEETADAETLARLNAQFHGLIYSAARNPYLRDVVEALQSSLELLPGTTYSAKGRPSEALEQHRALVDAIEAHDPELAGHVSREHLRAAERIRLLMLAEISISGLDAATGDGRSP